MVKRLFDLIISLALIVILAPVWIVLFLIIVADSRGGAFYLQRRVGQGGRDFNIIKFRTMHPDSERHGFLTIGGNDKRVTNAGQWLRKYKLDELPQLVNVLKGDMSLVGPRPEVRKFVVLYNDDQKKVLDVKPGITDYASILYANENEILGKSANPEKDYIEFIMPAKLALNRKYIDEANIATDIRIIFLTILKVFSLK